MHNNTNKIEEEEEEGSDISWACDTAAICYFMYSRPLTWVANVILYSPIRLLQNLFAGLYFGLVNEKEQESPISSAKCKKLLKKITSGTIARSIAKGIKADVEAIYEELIQKAEENNELSRSKSFNEMLKDSGLHSKRFISNTLGKRALYRMNLNYVSNKIDQVDSAIFTISTYIESAVFYLGLTIARFMRALARVVCRAARYVQKKLDMHNITPSEKSQTLLKKIANTLCYLFHYAYYSYQELKPWVTLLVNTIITLPLQIVDSIFFCATLFLAGYSDVERAANIKHYKNTIEKEKAEQLLDSLKGMPHFKEITSSIKDSYNTGLLCYKELNKNCEKIKNLHGCNFDRMVREYGTIFLNHPNIFLRNYLLEEKFDSVLIIDYITNILRTFKNLSMKVIYNAGACCAKLAIHLTNKKTMHTNTEQMQNKSTQTTTSSTSRSLNPNLR